MGHQVGPIQRHIPNTHHRKDITGNYKHQHVVVHRIIGPVRHQADVCFFCEKVKRVNGTASGSRGGAGALKDKEVTWI